MKCAMKSMRQDRQDVEGELQQKAKENAIGFSRDLEHSLERAALISTGKLVQFF